MSRSRTRSEPRPKPAKRQVWLQGGVWLTVGGEHLGGHGRIALLRAIEEHGSITQAAKACGKSYKAAWDAIDTMNNLAGKPVVSAAAGGKGGGGARLTTQGRTLLATYRAVEAESEQFVAGLNSRLHNAKPKLRTLGRLWMRTSARNQWVGAVTRIRRGAVNDEVEIKLAGRERIAAVITHESVENLGLEVGKEALALVKASSVMVATGGGPLKLSARNQLAGTISRVMPGAVNTEIVISLGGANTVAAIITNASARELKLKIGQKALAVFKASSVILGVT